MITKIDGKSPKLPGFHPLLKFFALVLLVVDIVIYPSWRLSFLLLCIVFCGFIISGGLPKISSMRTRVLIFFSLALFLIQVIVTINGEIVFYLIPQLDVIGPFIPVTDFGLERGLAYSTRFLLVVLSSMLFVQSTDPTLLAHSLTKLRIPYRYSFSLVIALRFIPLFDKENETVRMAQRSRGITPEVRGLSKILRTVRYTFFPLLVSALSKVDTLTLSMEGRGFGYKSQRSYLRRAIWRKRDTLGIIVILFLTILSLLLSLGFLPEIAIFL